ncbi:hypothetical protein K0M31_014066, partial [Melipona bicolor]
LVGSGTGIELIPIYRAEVDPISEPEYCHANSCTMPEGTMLEDGWLYAPPDKDIPGYVEHFCKRVSCIYIAPPPLLVYLSALESISRERRRATIGEPPAGYKRRADRSA